MIRIANYGNEFVKISLTTNDRIDISLLKNIFRDAQRVCKGRNLRIEVEISKNMILPGSTIAYFKKLYAVNSNIDFTYSWYEKSSIDQSAEKRRLVSDQLLNSLN